MRWVFRVLGLFLFFPIQSLLAADYDVTMTFMNDSAVGQVYIAKVDGPGLLNTTLLCIHRHLAEDVCEFSCTNSKGSGYIRFYPDGSTHVNVGGKKYYGSGDYDEDGSFQGTVSNRSDKESIEIKFN